MLKRHAIQVLRAAGHTLDEIVTLVAVGKRTVQRVVDEPMITDQSIAAPEREPRARPIGRPSKAEAYRARIAGWLTEAPDLLSVKLLRRAKLAGNDGAKTVLYDLVRDMRPSTPRPMVRFEGLPGEFTQHDFGTVIVRFPNGTTQRVHFCVRACRPPLRPPAPCGARRAGGSRGRAR